METTIVAGKMLIGGTGRAPIPNDVVMIEDGRITAVERSADKAAEAEHHQA